LSLKIPHKRKNSAGAGILSYDENKLRCDRVMRAAIFFEGKYDWIEEIFV
jgi:hypothetical protein